MEDALYWLVGALGVPLINWLKHRWNLSGKPAMWLTAAVAAVLGILALILASELSLDAVTPEAIMAVFGQVLAAATLAYNLLTNRG